MTAAEIARLGKLMALARQAAEARLMGLRAEIVGAEARRAALQAARTAPLGAASLREAGGLTAELDWRRGLGAQIDAEERRINDLTEAVEAARAELKHAFGRELAAERMAEAAAADEARRAGRRAEDRTQPRRPSRL